MSAALGLVGVGKMGTALLARLRLAGHPVRAFDIDDAAMARARDGGAETVASAAQAADGAAIVHVFVATDEQMADAVLGPAGVLKGARPGALVFLHATISPDTTRRIAAEAAHRDVTVMDACVTAVPRLFAAGEAIFLLGGPEDRVGTARAHLAPLGKDVRYFGPAGAGNCAKICKNLSNVIERVAVAEIAQLAAAAGLHTRAFLDMAASTSGGGMLARWDKAVALESAAQGARAVPKQAGGLLTKDIRLAAALATACGVDLPLTSGAASTAAAWVRAWEA